MFHSFPPTIPTKNHRVVIASRWSRFDVRGELTDVSRYEPPPGGYDNRLEYLNAAEQRAEQLCEEERYYSLHNNDFEEDLYKGK